MDERARFKQRLTSMIRSGVFQDIVGGDGERCAAVEFCLERVYTVQMGHRRITLHEQDRERIRRRVGDRWRNLRPIVVDRGCTVIDRPSSVLPKPPIKRSAGGRDYQAPGFGGMLALDQRKEMGSDQERAWPAAGGESLITEITDGTPHAPVTRAGQTRAARTSAQ